MDRRQFMQATFAGSAATVALGVIPVLPRSYRDAPVPPHPQGVAQMYERTMPYGTTDLGETAQYVMKRLADRLDLEGHATTLAESGHVDRDGQKIGMTVMAYGPGVEDFNGPRRVVLSDQIHALFLVPSFPTGKRVELYSCFKDSLTNVPERMPEAIVLEQLHPVVDHLVEQIRTAGVNVFSPVLYMPEMAIVPVEGAVGYASRTYGLALRVVRCIAGNDLVMRIDLLAGKFPVDTTMDRSDT